MTREKSVVKESEESPPEERFLVRWCEWAEYCLYVFIMLGFILLTAAVGGYMIYQVIAHPADRFLVGVVSITNDLLMMLILLSLMRTVVIILQNKKEVIDLSTLRPFLIVAIISTTRRILETGATLSSMEEVDRGMNQARFDQAMLELGVSSVVVLLLVLAFRLLRDRENEKAPDSA